MMQDIPFSDRTDWEFNENTITKAHHTLLEKNIAVYDLTLSNPTSCGLDYPSDVLHAFIDKNNLKYSPQAKGLLLAREAVSRYYRLKGCSVSADNVFLTSSTSEAYSYLFRLLANYGEEVLFPKPSYPLFEFLVDLNDLKMKRYELDGSAGWRIDFSSMAKEVSPLTRAVAFVNPNNPTGSYIKEDELKKLNQFCIKHRLAIIADEVFHDFAMGSEHKPVSFASNSEALTFTMSGISKILGLPQMKLAWIVVSGPDKLVKEANKRLEIIADTYLSASTPVQHAWGKWLDLKEPLQSLIFQRVKRNLLFLSQDLKTQDNCKLTAIEGGWYAVLRLPEGVDEEVLSLELLKKDHVFIHPGYFFDFTKGNFCVISLLPEEKIFQEGIKRLKARVEKCIHRP